MGLGQSRFAHSSNDYELVIKSSKDLEFILERDFGAQGRGLHEKISSVERELPGQLVRQMRYLATIRNKLIHERGFDSLPDRASLISSYEASALELENIIKSKNGQGSGCSIM